MKDFQIINKIGIILIYSVIHIYIGDGAYSVVYKVRRISDGQEYALKKVN